MIKHSHIPSQPLSCGHEMCKEYPAVTWRSSQAKLASRQTHDVARTSPRRRHVAGTSRRRRVFAGMPPGACGVQRTTGSLFITCAAAFSTRDEWRTAVKSVDVFTDPKAIFHSSCRDYLHYDQSSLIFIESRSSCFEIMCFY